MRILAIVLTLCWFMMIPAYAQPAPVIDRVPISDKVVAISIEGITTAVEMENTAALGETQNCKLTFFVSGQFVEKNTVIVKKIYDKGFEFGNYGVNARYWGDTTSEDIIKELAEAGSTLQKATGAVGKVVRPPYSYYEPNFVQAAAVNFLTVVRGQDTSDWTIVSSQAVVDRVKNTVQNGDIISINMKAKHSATALPEIIRELKGMGYQVITVSELLAKVPNKSAPKGPVVRPFGIISSFTEASPKVALTFDDGGSSYRVTRILEILKENGVHSTFFLNGDWIDSNPQLIQRITEDGHEVANHSYSHPVFSWLGPDEIETELASTEAAVKRTTGQPISKYFRPPYGDYNSSVVETVKSLGYEAIILWNVDTRDWSGVSAQTIINTVLNQVAGGSIVLFHLHATGTPDALSELIPTLKAQGYLLTTIGNLLE